MAWDSGAGWPDAEEILTFCDAAGIRLNLEEPEKTARVNKTLAGVTSLLERATKRQFVSLQETRYYDGSGTPLLETDDIVQLVSVESIASNGLAAYDYPNAILESVSGQPSSRIIQAQGVPFSVGFVGPPSGTVPYGFPAGRRNIKVEAVFGFAAEIPPDVREAVLFETADRLRKTVSVGASAAHGTPYRVVEERLGNRTTRYAEDSMEGSIFTAAFRETIVRYKVEAGRRLRNWRPAMV